MTLTRRTLLQTASLSAFAALLPTAASATSKAMVSLPFSFDSLVKQAETLAKEAYSKPETIRNEWLRGLSYDDYRELRFRRGKALWQGQRDAFRVEYFHPGAIFLEPVQLYEVVRGQAQPIKYDPALFEFGKLTPPEDLKNEQTGYAGFRVHTRLNTPSTFDEFLVFLGASYFRAVAKGQKYGLSARGLAVNTATANGEEFPSFRKFWIERSRGNTVTICALLDSPSVTGAYRFVVTPGDTTLMDVSCRLFIRQDIERLGVAPLTSMFAFGENDDRLNHDFRPEVHDSDGLLMATGSGEQLWRPIKNPETLNVSSFMDKSPKGFGLLQRDRAFSSYQDLEAFYEERPSLWVEPKGDWGAGSVQLVEIPTDSEIHDNIVAYWVPAAPAKAGQSLSFDYRLFWGNGPVIPRALAVEATHIGRQFDHDKVKFVVDFRPTGLAQKINAADLAPDIWTGAGQVTATSIAANPHNGGWRVAFDLQPDGGKVHELRCTLRQKGKAMSETWSYQWQK